jgi:hypothetical protein
MTNKGGVVFLHSQLVCPKLKYKRRQHFAVNLLNLLSLQKNNILFGIYGILFQKPVP